MSLLVGWTPEIIGDDERGLLFEPRDAFVRSDATPPAGLGNTITGLSHA